MRAGIVYAALLATVLAGPTFAADVTISNFAGKVTIVQGNDGLDVIRNGSEGDLDYSTNGDRIRIDGGLTRKQRGKACDHGGISWDLEWNNRRSEGDTRLKDYPELEISIPTGSTLTVEDSYIRLDADVDLDRAVLDMGGCFDARFQDAGEMSLNKSGSGDFSARAIGSLMVEKSGSGDLEFASADSFVLGQSGSGEVEIGPISGPVRIEKTGSGDVEVESVNGDVYVHKSGSGDIEIDGGRIGQLEIHNSGSGDVDIDAPAQDADVSASGSGDVYVRSVSGVLHHNVSGSGDFNLADD